jgi:capsular exopolysaccharide synthesis family protein
VTPKYDDEAASRYAVPVNLPEDYGDEEKGRHLWDYVHLILRRKWIVATFFLVTVTTVVIGTYLITPIYRATATIKIEQPNPFALLFGNQQQMYWQESSSQEYMETQLKILRSTKLARRVIRALGIERVARAPKAAAEPAKAPSRTGEPPEEGSPTSTDYIETSAVNSLVSQVNVAVIPKTKLVTISVDSPDPRFAARAANEITNSYIGLSMENKFESTLQARDWLEKQLIDMRAKVERSEEALNRFVSQNRIVRPLATAIEPSGQGGDGKGKTTNIDRLDELSTELARATSERIGKEMLLKEAKQDDDVMLSSIASNPNVDAIRKELAAKETEYAKLSVTYKPDYPKMVKLNEEIKVLKDQARKEAGRTISTIRKDYQFALARENFLRSEVEKYKQEALAMNDKIVQYQILKRDSDTNRELYNGILQRLKETGISASLTTSNIVVLDKAEVPRAPYKPDKTKNILFALLIGAAGGLGLAFFVEYLDNTVKTPDDVEKSILLSSLGIVPYQGVLLDKEVKPMIAGVTATDKKSTLVEAYRSISTYIQFSSPVRAPKLILVTSARAGEGKTTTGLNLGVTMGNSVGKGVLIDSDLRKPQLHKVFNLDNSNGLSSYLTGHAELDTKGFIQSTGLPNLDVIVAGIIPPNPSELLSSFRMKDLLADLFDEYSFVIIDSPPILGLSDSLVLSTITDGVIIVVRAGQTPKESVIQARKLLRGVNARILGVVLNGIRESDLRYSSYSYYYSYYYAEDESGGKTRKKGKKRTEKSPRLTA